jgi:hypothetical protein
MVVWKAVRWVVLTVENLVATTASQMVEQKAELLARKMADKTAGSWDLTMVGWTDVQTAEPKAVVTVDSKADSLVDCLVVAMAVLMAADWASKSVVHWAVRMAALTAVLSDCHLVERRACWMAAQTVVLLADYSVVSTAARWVVLKAVLRVDSKVAQLVAVMGDAWAVWTAVLLALQMAGNSAVRSVGQMAVLMADGTDCR